MLFTRWGILQQLQFVGNICFSVATTKPGNLSFGVAILFGLASTQVQGGYGIAFLLMDVLKGTGSRKLALFFFFLTRVVVLHCHIEMFLIGYLWWKVNVWLFLWRSASAILPMLASCAFLVLSWSSWPHHSVVLV